MVKLKDMPSDPSPLPFPDFWQTAGWSCATSEMSSGLIQNVTLLVFPLFSGNASVKILDA